MAEILRASLKSRTQRWEHFRILARLTGRFRQFRSANGCFRGARWTHVAKWALSQKIWAVGRDAFKIATRVNLFRTDIAKLRKITIYLRGKNDVSACLWLQTKKLAIVCVSD